jgi:signal transduction histidine kinase
MPSWILDGSHVWGSLRTLAALPLVAMATGLRHLLVGELGRGIPYLTFFPAVTVASLVGGFSGGLLATLLSALTSYYWIEQGQMSLPEAMALGIFITSNLLIAAVAETVGRSRARARRALLGEAAANARLRDEIAVHQADQTALAVSEIRFRSLFAGMTEGVALHELVYDAMGEVVDYRILDVNPAFERHTSISAEQARGALASELYRSTPPPFLASYSKVATAQMTFRFEAFHALLGKHFRILAFSTQAGQFATVFEDITMRKKAEAARILNEDLLAEAQAMARLGSYVLDLSAGCFIGTSIHDEILGIDTSHGHGRSLEEWFELIHPDFKTMMADCTTWESARDCETFDREYKIIRPGTGEVRWVHGVGRFRTNPDSQQEKLIGTIQDITERKQELEERARLQAQLQQAQKMESLGVLTSGIAHDMNNVLGAILGLASAHTASQPPGTSAYRAFGIIQKAAIRGGVMVKQLLSFARQKPPLLEELDVNALLQEEMLLLERTLLSRVRLELDLASDLPSIYGDYGTLANAVMNLCVNAVDAMPEGGTIAVRTGRDDADWIAVTIEDTGTGMSKEVLARAMEPFFTTKEVGKGTGLGLSMVYSMMKAQQGALEIHSEPGQGTRVVLRFPVAGRAPSPGGPGVEARRVVEVLP